MGFKNLTNDVLVELQIYILNNYQLKHKISQTDYFEFILEASGDKQHLINLTLTSISQNNDINKFYFYFTKSYKQDTYTKLTYDIKPNNYSKEFTVLKELNLLLDISNVPA